METAKDGGAAVRRAHPPADRGRGLRPRPDDHGEPRRGLPPRGRRSRAGGHRDRRGLGALRGQARGQEPGRGSGRCRRHRKGSAGRLGPVSAVAERPSVLIVDDERMIRELLGDVFACRRLPVPGSRATARRRSRRSRRSVRRSPITDIRMPVLDGDGVPEAGPHASILMRRCSY